MLLFFPYTIETNRLLIDKVITECEFLKQTIGPFKDFFIMYPESLTCTDTAKWTVYRLRFNKKIRKSGNYHNLRVLKIDCYRSFWRKPAEEDPWRICKILLNSLIQNFTFGRLPNERNQSFCLLAIEKIFFSELRKKDILFDPDSVKKRAENRKKYYDKRQPVCEIYGESKEREQASAVCRMLEDSV